MAKSYIQETFEKCSGVERDRIAAAEICVDECLTILDRHGCDALASVYQQLRSLSIRLHEASTAVDGLEKRRERLRRIRQALTNAIPMTDADLKQEA